MSLRSVALFDRMGRPTPFLMAQWRSKGAVQPLQAATQYLRPDRTATGVLRGLWGVAFPTRDFLPFEPLADADGKGTQRFWDVFAE